MDDWQKIDLTDMSASLQNRIQWSLWSQIIKIYLHMVPLLML